MDIREQRRARIEFAFEIEGPDGAPMSVSAGDCWIEHHDRDVAMHLGRDVGHEVIHISNLQFQQALNNHQLVFTSW